MDKEYKLDSLDSGTLNMIALYKEWKADGASLKKEYLKNEGACRDLAREIHDRLENKKKNSPYISSVNESGAEVVEFKKK